MTAPDDKLSKRTIVIIALAAIAATALTIEGTYFVIKTHVFDQNDPPVKAGGSSWTRSFARTNAPARGVIRSISTAPGMQNYSALANTWCA